MVGSQPRGVEVIFSHVVDTCEAIHAATSGVDSLVLAQYSQQGRSVQSPVWHARLGGQLPHLCNSHQDMIITVRHHCS